MNQAEMDCRTYGNVNYPKKVQKEDKTIFMIRSNKISVSAPSPNLCIRCPEITMIISLKKRLLQISKCMEG